MNQFINSSSTRTFICTSVSSEVHMFCTAKFENTSIHKFLPHPLSVLSDVPCCTELQDIWISYIHHIFDLQSRTASSYFLYVQKCYMVVLQSGQYLMISCISTQPSPPRNGIGWQWSVMSVLFTSEQLWLMVACRPGALQDVAFISTLFLFLAAFTLFNIWSWTWDLTALIPSLLELRVTASHASWDQGLYYHGWLVGSIDTSWQWFSDGQI